MTNSCRFFLLLPPDFDSMLILPPELSNVLPSENSVVTLSNLKNGKLWEVDLVIDGNDHCFEGERWQSFTVANDLTFGSLLNFCFHGDSHFTFRAFNMSCLEIVVPSENVHANEEEEEVLDSPETTETTGRHASEQHKACFYAKMTAANITGSGRYMFNVPSIFKEEIGLSLSKSVIITDPRGQRWTVSCSHRHDHLQQTSFTRNWRNLVLANDLKAGDSIKIEEVSKDEGGMISLRMTQTT